MKEPRGQELVDRYKLNYNISPDVDISEANILRHWELEKELAQQLMASTPENRWDIFDRSYTALYSELPWLNASGHPPEETRLARNFAIWPLLIGDPPKKVYEIGSGKGELIEYLASCQYECRATEITRERGPKHTATQDKFSWQVSDGIHLDHFESSNSHDVAISNQVIEHMHPDDLLTHFESVASILTPGGRYIFATPHSYLGPSDVSRVFKRNEPIGMHLKEYCYRELCPLLKEAGFQRVRAVWRMPPKVSARLGFEFPPRVSGGYLDYLCLVERLLSVARHQATRRKIASWLRLMFFPTDIFLVAIKKRA